MAAGAACPEMPGECRLHSFAELDSTNAEALRRLAAGDARPGDVFAAAYLVRYGETADELESARFASCAASFCVQAQGADGIPTRPAVEARLREGGA